MQFSVVLVVCGIIIQQRMFQGAFDGLAAIDDLPCCSSRHSSAAQLAAKTSGVVGKRSNDSVQQHYPQSFMLAISSWFLRSQIASISASSSAQRCCQALHPSTGFCYWWNLVHSVKSWRCIVLLLLSYSSLASSAATNPRHPHRLHLHKDALSHRHPVSCPLTSSLCCCLTARTRRASLLAPRAVSPCPAQTKLQQLQH